jgi:hypothetical protein
VSRRVLCLNTGNVEFSSTEVENYEKITFWGDQESHMKSDLNGNIECKFRV